MSMEDLIAEEDVVVTITRGGYAKRTLRGLYRSQRRGGKGVRGAALRRDDLVQQFFVTTTHHWILFFTNKGRVYRTKAYELPEAARDARGQHVANLLAFQPDETIVEVLDPRLRGRAVPGARHPARAGEEDPARASTTRPGPAASSRSTCARTTSCSARAGPRTTLTCFVLAQGAVDAVLRRRRGDPADGAGDQWGDRHAVPGWRRDALDVGHRRSAPRRCRGGRFVFTVTDGGFAKRTPSSEYRVQGRGGLGIKAADRGGPRLARRRSGARRHRRRHLA